MASDTPIILLGERAEVKPRPRQTDTASKRLGRFTLIFVTLATFAFLYVPIFVLIFFSFNSTKSTTVFSGFSLQWYEKMLGNELLLAAAGRSLLVGVVATLIAVVLATLMALAMERYEFKSKTAWDGMLYMPVVVPEIIAAVSLLLFFAQLKIERGYFTLIIAHVAFIMPFIYLTVRARLADFDRSVEEAAKDLGANELTTFRRVTLPLLMPGIVSGALLGFTLSMDDFVISNFVKGVKMDTLPVYVWPQLKRTVSPEINAISALLLVFSIGVVVASLLLQRRQSN